MTHWVHDLSPFLIEFSPTFGIRYYGLAYLLGFAAAAWLLRTYRRSGLSPLDAEQSSDLLFALVLGVFVGGRLGYFILYEPSVFLREPLALLRVWDGGMASHGGFAGVLIAGVWFARKHRIPLARLADLVATLAPPGLLLGRVANFINGELWGRVSQVPWAVIFPQSAPGMPVASIPARHPSQLYEAFAEGLVLLIYTQVRFWTRSGRTRPQGQLCGEFLVGYAVARIACEVFREPDVGASPIFGLSRGAAYSIALLAVGTALIVRARIQGSARNRA